MDEKVSPPLTNPGQPQAASLSGERKRVVVKPDRFAKYASLGGPLSILCFFLMLPMAGFLPPKSPSMSTEKVVAHYIHHETALKGGIAMMTFVGLFFPLYTAAVGGQLSRIPGMPKTVIYTQLIGGCLGGLFLTLPSYFFAVTMYRLDRPPDITQALHDQAWLYFAMPFPSLLAQDLSFSYGVLLDKREKPLFPHWLAYFSTGMTLAFWPALGAHCVKSGAIAWNGGLTFWTAGVGGGLQVVVMSFYTWLAAGRDDLPTDGHVFTRSDFYLDDRSSASEKTSKDLAMRLSHGARLQVCG